MSSAIELRTTSDGSHTFYNSQIGEQYHSKHGAFQESQHVFLNSGFVWHHQLNQHQEINVLEVGFGTGLNFLITAEYCKVHQLKLNYTGIELYPLNKEQLLQTQYHKHLEHKDVWDDFLNHYENALQEVTKISDNIQLRISKQALLEFHSEIKSDIIYFDAFAAIHQPEMWDHTSIKHACSFLKDKGIFVTYSVTGELKRHLKSLGFSIERPAGAVGKREMMRATLNKKPDDL